MSATELLQEPKPKILALFDFDGTLTNHDSFFKFLAFSTHPVMLLYKSLRCLPALLMYILGIWSNHRAKEAVFSVFFRNWKEEQFRSVVEAYLSEILLILNETAMHCLNNHRQRGHDIFIVTATPEAIIRPFCRANKCGLIGTKTEVNHGSLTGRFEGNNCYGEEKVRRIRLDIDLDSYDEIFAYGDTEGDRPMLNLADKSYFRSFHNFED